MEYAADRLKSKIWVQAQTRLCDSQNIPLFVVRKGHADAGIIIVKINRLAAGCEVLIQARGASGALGWRRGAGDGEHVAEADADAYIAKQLNFDPDLWVIEIEDPEGRYQIDGEIFA